MPKRSHYAMDVLLKFVLIFVMDTTRAVTQHDTFGTSTSCQLSARILQGCSTDVSPSRGLVDCLTWCSRNASCVGASWVDEKWCFHHQVCDPDVQCETSDPGFTIWSRVSAVDEVPNAADCPPGCTGTRCDRCPRDCEDLVVPGVRIGLHEVLIDPDQDGRDIIPVLCDIRSPSTSRIRVLSSFGLLNLNRTWTEHVEGFFQDWDNNWLGLKHIHTLTSYGYTTLETLFYVDLGPYNFMLGREYSNFVVQDESRKFAFSFTSSSRVFGGEYPGNDVGELGIDCLEPVQHTAFSTWDRDNDGNVGTNCAARVGPGWWGSDCGSPCHLFGTGFNNWDATPTPLRWSWPHMDMESLKTWELSFDMFLARP